MTRHRKLTTFTALVATALVTTSLAWAQQNDQDNANESAAGTAQNQNAPAGQTQAYLGLGVAPLHPALTNHLPDVIGEGRGVMVEEVVKGSPADQAGLKQYDVLVRINDQELYSPEQLVKIIRNSKPGSEVAISYVRHGKIQDAKVTLGEVPARAPVRSFSPPAFPFGSQLDRFPQLDQFPWPPAFQRNFPPTANVPSGSAKDRWEAFESFSLKKQADGTYELKLQYRDADGKQIEREFVGTADEVKKAIQDDKELPENERQRLMRMLDQPEGILPRFRFPWANDWQRELFNWPNLDF